MPPQRKPLRRGANDAERLVGGNDEFVQPAQAFRVGLVDDPDRASKRVGEGHWLAVLFRRQRERRRARRRAVSGGPSGVAARLTLASSPQQRRPKPNSEGLA